MKIIFLFVCDIMAKLISALLFLNLVSYTSQELHLKDESNIVQTGSGKLHCSSRDSILLDQGVYWFHQKNSNKQPTFLLFVNSLGKKISSKDAGHFGSQKDSRGYNLEFKSFDHSQESTYYCLSIYNSEIHFSPGIPLYFPELREKKWKVWGFFLLFLVKIFFFPVTTKAPTTPSTSTAVAPKPSTAGRRENCTRAKPPDPREGRALNVPCELYIWVPLAGACLILLIIVVVTSIILCKYSRRKRFKQYCHCRKRPMKENNGRLNPSDRYV
uniref:T-cell surface glycoprotein CD8 alpha chain n=1 Tax=Geotrypetes seraphini TaxID=260995 RepID=A0A6P8SBJ1_GEOSA|nr:T-cell surface glycoprotein CD8 alpha chain [Geotrypetes seraphini]